MPGSGAASRAVEQPARGLSRPVGRARDRRAQRRQCRSQGSSGVHGVQRHVLKRLSQPISSRRRAALMMRMRPGSAARQPIAEGAQCARYHFARRGKVAGQLLLRGRLTDLAVVLRAAQQQSCNPHLGQPWLAVSSTSAMAQRAAPTGGFKSKLLHRPLAREQLAIDRARDDAEFGFALASRPRPDRQAPRTCS